MIILIISAQFAFSQSNAPTKKQLLKTFKNSIRQDKSGWISPTSNPWVICNRDSAFYKADTIELYSANFHIECCNSINWTFYKKDAFVLTRMKICEEPTTISAPKAEDFFTIQVREIDGELILETFCQAQLVDTYKVLKIEKNTYPKCITLVRLAIKRPLPK